VGRENKKASPSLESDWEALIALPGLFPSKSWAEYQFPGRFPGFRVIAQSSAFPFRAGAEQWLGFSPERIRLADHSGGTAADFHGLPFYPDFNRDAAGA